MRQRRGDTSTSAKEGYLHRLQSAPAAQKRHEKSRYIAILCKFFELFRAVWMPQRSITDIYNQMDNSTSFEDFYPHFHFFSSSHLISTLPIIVLGEWKG